MTLVTWGAMIVETLRAASELANAGVEAHTPGQSRGFMPSSASSQQLLDSAQRVLLRHTRLPTIRN